jgi:hypothetical protein
MKLRVVVISFQKDTQIQFGNAVKTYKAGRELRLVEIGYLESYGRDHFIGVEESGINDVRLIRDSIEDIEEMLAPARLRWFQARFPQASVVKIESAKLFDRLRKMKNNMDARSYNATITSAFDLTWKKKSNAR